MESSNFPSSSIGLPQSLNYVLPPSLSDDARSYTVSMNPSGTQSVTGLALPTTVFTANSGTNLGNFNNSLITFDIPCGSSPSVFLDPRETVLSFRLTWVVTTAAANTGGVINLISSASSFFDNLTLYHNNTPIEIVASYNLLFANFLTANVNPSERFGAVAISLGCETSKNTGIDLPTAVGTYYFNFSVPLISIIGLSTLDKLLPIGSISNLQLQLMTSQILPVSSFCTATTTQPVISAPVLDQFNLSMRYIDIGAYSASLLNQSLQNGKFFMKSRTYTNSNVTIPSGSSGFTSLLLQIRNSSINSIFLQYGVSTGALALCPNYSFDSINPSLISLQMSIGGQKYPQKPLNPSARPCETYSALAAAWKSLDNLSEYGGVMNRGSYAATLPSPGPAPFDNSITIPAAGVRPISKSNTNTEVIVSFPNAHYQGFDVSRCSGTLFSGVNTRSSPPYVELNLGLPSVQTITCYSWAMSDVVLVIDTMSKSIQAFI